MSEAALELAEQWREDYASPVDIATLFAHAARKEETLEWLQRAYDVGAPRLHFAAVDPDLDFLRTEPPYLTLLRRMNFPERLSRP